MIYQFYNNVNRFACSGVCSRTADDLSRRHRWNWHGTVWCQKGRKETHLCGQNASHGESVEQRLVCCCSQWQKHSWQTWRWRCWEYVWSSSGSTPVFAARNDSCCGWVGGFQKCCFQNGKNPFERGVTLDKNFYSHRETLERIFA